LQAMRDMSPTGGALGSIAVRELELLQSTLGSLDIGQSHDQLVRNLQAVKDHYSKWLSAVNEATEAGGGRQAQKATESVTPSGLKYRVVE
jgi:hypothetical protein